MEKEGSFASFVARTLANTFTFSEDTVTYKTNEKTMEAVYDQYFTVNGDVVDTEYGRFESAYMMDGKVEQKADVIGISFGGETLVLNFKEGTREQ